MAITTVALIGAGGNLGPTVLNALISASFRVTIIASRFVQIRLPVGHHCGQDVRIIPRIRAGAGVSRSRCSGLCCEYAAFRLSFAGSYISAGHGRRGRRRDRDKMEQVRRSGDRISLVSISTRQVLCFLGSRISQSVVSIKHYHLLRSARNSLHHRSAEFTGTNANHQGRRPR